ncbi:hypothetical protein EZJ43_01290 [Pedobacter changchengzhani]|uniref:Uncharacterized protein n=1 Tax=Pedobacter changchengzhani TaxID=2529274 RepID=A0A4R5MPH3_9SPHI|nr:DUF6804 family protein [Pedobacter changchengzhani]TDG37757.1 hypothetical protein EZJ43_01290 [Pedobacter changchengzhani]
MDGDKFLMNRNISRFFRNIKTESYYFSLILGVCLSLYIYFHFFEGYFYTTYYFTPREYNKTIIEEVPHNFFLGIVIDILQLFSVIFCITLAIIPLYIASFIYGDFKRKIFLSKHGINTINRKRILKKLYLILITILAICLLLLAYSGVPYVYYQLIKIGLALSFVFAAIVVRNITSILYLFFASVFNPIAPLIIKKQQWRHIDLATITVSVVLMVIFCLLPTKSKA